jgi:hypothetical protein
MSIKMLLYDCIYWTDLDGISLLNAEAHVTCPFCICAVVLCKILVAQWNANGCASRTHMFEGCSSLWLKLERDASEV